MNSGVYRSATLKLTVWYLGIVVAISLVFSGVVYHFATSALASGLTSQSQRIYRNFPVFSGDPFFRHSSDLTNGSHRILIQLVEFNVVVFVAAGFASYWLAKRTLKPIEESNEHQKRFVADASHELRTPLTALKMSSEVALLDKKISQVGLREALKSNLEEADKLDTLINNLLRLSQLEADEMRLKFADLSTSLIASLAIDHIRKQAEAKSITINNEVKDLATFGDRDSLVQLLVILLDNAIKYSSAESSIEMSSSHDQHYVSIAVTDHGAGIEPAALSRVFDRFYRTDKARNHGDSEGFGLGLSIAKQIADLHDGNITISSKLGHGTKVTLQLLARKTE